MIIIIEMKSDEIRKQLFTFYHSDIVRSIAYSECDMFEVLLDKQYNLCFLYGCHPTYDDCATQAAHLQQDQLT